MFKDRRDAGAQLARHLAGREDPDCVVLGLPRGGVVVAAEVARALRGSLGVAISRKVGHPLSPEYAVAAVSDQGDVVLNPLEASARAQPWFDDAVRKATEEARRRAVAYKQLVDPPLSGRTVYLVDDGAATGLTLAVSAIALRREDPKTIVAALPISPRSVVVALGKIVDEVVALEVPLFFEGAVGCYYEDFTQVSEAYVESLLIRSRRPESG